MISPQTKKVLHVGCGPQARARDQKLFSGPEWQEVRLDIDPGAKPDIVASITDMAPVETGSMDGLYSSHNLEHLYPHEVPLALKEFRRVLSPTGFALITLPDLQSIAELIVADKLDDPAYVSPAGPICPLDMLYGYRPFMGSGNLFMAHKTGFTAKTLVAACFKAGFPRTGYRRGANFDLWVIAYVSPDGGL